MARKRALGPLPEEHIRKLARRLIDGQLSLFVGAGISHLAPAKDASTRRLPLWSGLTEQVAAACNQEAEVFSGDPLEFFDAIAFDQERGTLERALSGALDDTAFDLAPVHRVLGDLPWRAVVTTNYDGLLPRLLGEEPIVSEEDYDRRFAPEKRQPRLFQVHGTRHRPHTLTRDDYRLWEEKHPRAAKHIHELLERGTFLFVGYSLSDPHLDAMLARVRQMTRGREKRLYAWMWRYPEQKIRLLDQRDKIEAVSIEREEHWEAAFQQLAAAVKELRREECAPPPPAGPDPFAYDREQYLRAVRTRYGAANLQGLYVWGAGYARDDVALEEVFVEPDLLRHEPGTPTEPDAVVPKTLRDLRRLREQTQEVPDPLGRRLSAFKLFQQESRVIVVGAPGQGKSTLLRAWLLKAAEGWAARPDSQPFPALVRLAEWERKAEVGEAGLLDLLREGLPSFGEIGSNAAQEWLEGPVLWLLDGVDEVRDRYEREHLREEVLAVAARRPGDRWIVSTRPAGEPAGGWAAGWARTELPSLTDRQIEAVLAAWGQVLDAKEGLALDAREMARRLQKDPGLRTLRGNALLLTLAVLFYKARRRLPLDRWEFFEVAEQVLRDSWVYHRVRRAEEHLPGGYLPELLERLALSGMKEGIVLFSRERLEQEAAGLLTERGYVGAERDREVARFLRAAEDLIGILVAQGPDQFGFLHFTFQEFLAARALVHRSAETREAIARYWDHPDWEQVWVLYALGIQSDSARLAELYQTILASGCPLDEHLKRPRFMTLRLAGVGTSPLPEQAQESLDWAVDVVRSDATNWRLLAAWRMLVQWERPLPKPIPEIALASTLNSTINIKPEIATALQLVASEPGIRQELLERLENDEPRVRSTTAWVLRYLAFEPSVRNALLQRLEDSEPVVVLTSGASLGQFATEPAVRQALLERLESSNHQVRSVAAWALNSAVTDPEVCQALLRTLDDPENDVQASAVQALSSVASEPVVRQALLARLKDGDPWTRYVTAANLDFNPLQPEMRKALLELLEAEDHQIRSIAIISLGSVVSETKIKEIILEHLAHDAPEVRSAAASALSSAASDPEVWQALLKRLNDRNPRVSLDATESLISVASEPPVRQALMKRLHDEDPTVRWSAAWAFSFEVADHELSLGLLQLLQDQDSMVRAAATRALGSVAFEPAVRQALLVRLQDEEADVRRAAAMALDSLASEPEVSSALLRRLDDENLDVQQAAVASLIKGIERAKFGLE